MVKKIKVLKNGIETNGAVSDQFESLEAFEAWKQNCIDSNVWGLPERWLQDTPMTPLSDEDKAKAIETRVVEVMGEQVTEYKFAAEYDVAIEDIIEQIEAEKKSKADKEKRKKDRKDSRKVIDWSKNLTTKQLQEIVKNLVEGMDND